MIGQFARINRLHETYLCVDSLRPPPEENESSQVAHQEVEEEKKQQSPNKPYDNTEYLPPDCTIKQKIDLTVTWKLTPWKYSKLLQLLDWEIAKTITDSNFSSLAEFYKKLYSATSLGFYAPPLTFSCFEGSRKLELLLQLGVNYRFNLLS